MCVVLLCYEDGEKVIVLLISYYRILTLLLHAYSYMDAVSVVSGSSGDDTTPQVQ